MLEKTIQGIKVFTGETLGVVWSPSIPMAYANAYPIEMIQKSIRDFPNWYSKGTVFIPTDDPKGMIDKLFEEWKRKYGRLKMYQGNDPIVKGLLTDGQCAYCNDPATQMDHVIPKSKRGTNNKNNLLPTCRKCNTRWTNRLSFLKDCCQECWEPALPSEIDEANSLCYYYCCGKIWQTGWNFAAMKILNANLNA